jgi:hypothetical protein
MSEQLKKNLQKAYIFILFSSVTGLLEIPACGIVQHFALAPGILLLVYTLFCTFILIWSSIQIIRKLPLKESWRIFILFAWLIFYPVAATIWISICTFFAMYVFNLH